MRAGRCRQVIITADDFGLHPAVNTAVERAHIDGVLNTASLMVAAPAAQNAVIRAHNLPNLRVGLHLVLADGRAVLAPAQIPDLVNANGEFGADMARAGARFFFRPRVRRQLAAEIRAQFDAYAATGLALDHVNAHKHFHLHPTIAGLILSIGRDYGLHAVRLPREPLRASLRESTGTPRGRLGASVFLAPWLMLLKWRLELAHIACNDWVYGVTATGHMDEAALLRALRGLPAGVTEIYLHPATRSCIRDSMAGYDHAGELAALLSPRVRALMKANDLRQISFTELSRHA